MLTPRQSIPRITGVKALPSQGLRVRWDDGRQSDICLADWVAALDPAVTPAASAWATLRIVDFGAAVQWGDDTGCAIDSLHLRLLADEQQPPEQV
ncbi:hypothetical protein [Caenispirillum bisanense]|uniref:hypothetical protein n=1 Tax=Caenispirillum bisanense TaxID=414052 RepID=UPI0031D3B589